MSLETMYDREVTVIPLVAPTTDDRGNEIVVDGTPIPGVRAMRNLTSTAEDLDGRDQTVERWVYFLAPRSTSGTVVPHGARARIVDGDQTLEVDGRIREAQRRRRNVTHHLEAPAYLIEG